MKTTRAGILICGMLMVVQTVQSQTVQPTPIQAFTPLRSVSTLETNKPAHNLVLPDLNPLDLATAQSAALVNGQDVIVLIGAKWCAPCQTMKNYIMPQVAHQGGLEQLPFAYIDFDTQNETATALMQGTMVPQLVYLRHQSGQWKSLAVLHGQVEPSQVMELITSVQQVETTAELHQSAASPGLPIAE